MAAQVSSVSTILSKFYPYYNLVPKTDSYHYGTRIIRLPLEIAARGPEGRQLFMEVLKTTSINRFKILKGAEKNAWIQQKIKEGQKLVPPGHYTEKIFVLVKAASIVLICVIIHAYRRSSL